MALLNGNILIDYKSPRMNGLVSNICREDARKIGQFDIGYSTPGHTFIPNQLACSLFRPLLQSSTTSPALFNNPTTIHSFSTKEKPILYRTLQPQLLPHSMLMSSFDVS